MEELKKQGWNITDEGFNLLCENGTIKDLKRLTSNALSTDIKEFGESVLSALIKKGKSGQIILQIQKIRNVSAPKAKEDSQAAPRMLKLILTDGHTSCQAVEVANIPALSRTHTPPGTKILINNALISCGCLLLTAANCSLLGGKVPSLCEKWELVKDMSNHVRTLGGSDGAPPWVNFGEKIVSVTSGENFKSLVTKEVKDGVDEFALQRQDAIAVASTGAVKKVFGGGGTVKAANEAQNNHFNSNKKFENNFREDRKNFKGRREPREKNVMEKQQKPAEKVSLFDFLEDKLAVSEVKSDNHSYSRQEAPQKPRDLPPRHFSSNSQQKFNSYSGNSHQNYNSSTHQQSHNSSSNTHQNYNTSANSHQNYNNSSSNSLQNYNSSNSHQNYNNPSNNYHNYNHTSNSNQNYNPASNYNQNYNASPNPHQNYNSSNSHSYQKFQGNNRQLNQTAKNDTNSLTKLSNNLKQFSLNDQPHQFAKRTLQQHLNLEPKNQEQKNNPDGFWKWKVGDLCMAKYWEDGKYYNARVIDLTEKTCVVQFNGYGNFEEILMLDCIPMEADPGAKPNTQHSKGSSAFRNNKRHYTNNGNFNRAS